MSRQLINNTSLLFRNIRFLLCSNLPVLVDCLCSWLYFLCLINRDLATATPRFAAIAIIPGWLFTIYSDTCNFCAAVLISRNFLLAQIS